MLDVETRALRALSVCSNSEQLSQPLGLKISKVASLALTQQSYVWKKTEGEKLGVGLQPLHVSWWLSTSLAWYALGQSIH